MHAEEGDIRLIDKEMISNWVTGKPQVFFEGSWSQVCAGEFGAPDANVACRQLGYGAGTTVPQFLTDADRVTLRTTAVFPEIGISASGCTGSEDRLLDCDQDLVDMFNRGCLNADGFGLVLACVGTPAQGVLDLPRVRIFYRCHRRSTTTYCKLPMLCGLSGMFVTWAAL